MSRLQRGWWVYHCPIRHASISPDEHFRLINERLTEEVQVWTSEVVTRLDAD